MLSDSFFHLAAYSSSIAGASTNATLSAVNDGILTISNNAFLIPRKGELVAAAAFGVNCSRQRLNTPDFRYVGLPSIVPVNQALTVPSPPNVADFRESPLKLQKVDQTTIESTNTDAGAQTHVCLVVLAFGRKTVPPGNITRLRGTAAITAVAGSWVNGTLTLDQTLPQGQYAVVGMMANGTNLLGARLIFAGAPFRPGCLAQNAVNGIPHKMFTDGSLGTYGTFENANLPNLEIFTVAACTAQEVFLDVVRIGDVGAM